MGVDNAAAQYWESPVTRAESQKVFDEYAQMLVKLQEQILKHEFVMSFLVEKFGVTPADVQAYADAKAKAFIENQKAATSNGTNN